MKNQKLLADKKSGSVHVKKIAAAAAVGLYLFLNAVFVLAESDAAPWKQCTVKKDSSVFEYVSLVIQNGGVPYRDVFDHKGPLLYLLNALGNQILFYRGIWFVELASMLLTVFFIFKIALKFVSKSEAGILTSAVLVTLTSSFAGSHFFEGGNLTEEYALPFLSVSLCIFIEYFLEERISRFRLIVCGLCFGAVLMLRPNMVALWVAFCLGVLIFHIKKYKKIPWSFLGWFMVGCMVAVLPIILWLCAEGAFQSFIQDYFLFNKEYASDIGLRAIFKSMKRCSCSPIFWINFLFLMILMKERKNVYFHAVYFGYAVLSLIFLSMSGREYGHYGMVLLPCLIYPLGAFVSYFEKSHNKGNARTIEVWTFYGILFVLMILPWFKESAKEVASGICNQESFASASVSLTEEQTEIIRLIQENTTENDCIQVIGNTCNIYILSHRFAASRYAYQPSLSGGYIPDQICEEFQKDLKEKLPKIVIVSYTSAKYRELFCTIDQYELLTESSTYGEVYRLKE